MSTEFVVRPSTRRLFPISKTISYLGDYFLILVCSISFQLSAFSFSLWMDPWLVLEQKGDLVKKIELETVAVAERRKYFHSERDIDHSHLRIGPAEKVSVVNAVKREISPKTAKTRRLTKSLKQQDRRFRRASTKFHPD